MSDVHESISGPVWHRAAISLVQKGSFPLCMRRETKCSLKIAQIGLLLRKKKNALTFWVSFTEIDGNFLNATPCHTKSSACSSHKIDCFVFCRKTFLKSAFISLIK